MTARQKAQATAKKAAQTAARRKDPLVKVEDQRRVVALWLAGATVSEIERAVNLSRATILRVRKTALDEGLKDRDKLAAELRERELLTLDRLQRAHWQRALDGNVGSSKIVLTCIEKRARFLGLEAPIKVDAQVKSELDAQIEALVEELEAQGLAARSMS